MPSYQTYEEKFLSLIQAKNEDQLLKMLDHFEFSPYFILSSMKKIIAQDLSIVVSKIIELRNLKNNIGFEWISQAIKGGSVKILKIFLNNGGEMEEYDPILKEMTLYWSSAAISENPEMIDFMFNYYKNHPYKLNSIFKWTISHHKFTMVKYMLDKYLPSININAIREAIPYSGNKYELFCQLAKLDLITPENSGYFIFSSCKDYYLKYNGQNSIENDIKGVIYLFRYFPPNNFDWERFVRQTSWTEIDYLNSIISFFEKEENSKIIFENLLIKQASLGNVEGVKLLMTKYKVNSKDKYLILEKTIQGTTPELIDLFIVPKELTHEKIHKLLLTLVRIKKPASIKKLLSYGIDMSANYVAYLKASIEQNVEENVDFFLSLIPEGQNIEGLMDCALYGPHYDLIEKLLDKGVKFSNISREKLQQLYESNRPKIIEAISESQQEHNINPAEILYNAVDAMTLESVKFMVTNSQITEYDLNRCLHHLLNIERNYDDVTPYGMESPEVFYLSMEYHNKDPNKTPYPAILEQLVNAGANKEIFTQKEIQKIIQRGLWRTIQFLYSIQTNWNWDLIPLLAIAFEQNHDKIAEVLFHHGTFSRDEYTMICEHALKWKKDQWIEYVKQKGMNLHRRNNDYNILLQQALLSQNIPFIRYLLEQKVKPEDFKIQQQKWQYIKQNSELMNLLMEFGYTLTYTTKKSQNKILL